VTGRTTFFRAVFVMVTTVAIGGCGQSPITPIRIESALEATFANLVQLQISALGLPRMSALDFGVTASCRKLARNMTGAGEWICNLAWLGPDRQSLRDTYDLFVGTDGCYTATVEGNNLGGPILKASDGRDVKNLLFTLEGCFDTT
jgi:hypothetical protein